MRRHQLSLRNCLHRLAWLAAALVGCGIVRAQPHPRPPATPAIARYPGADTVAIWLTTADRAQLLARQPDALLVDTAPAEGVVIDVDERRRYQTMVGFGASITDASAFLIHERMTVAQREVLLTELFSRSEGIGLDFTRLTIGASDFSSSHYSLDDVQRGESDTTLSRFSIDSNRTYLLPVVQRAVAINPRLTIMATPWSAPGWMKTSGSLIKGTLEPKYYGVFARYLLRYVKEYEAEGVPIHLLSLQNEPHFEPEDYPGMRLDPAARATLFKEHVGPLFAREEIETKLLDWDHNWDQPDSPLAVLSDPAARRYVAGVAWHCYGGTVSAQTRVRDAYPSKEVYFTECSGGGWSPDWGKNLDFAVGTLIVDATRHWARGILLWNLALDENSGPHKGGCGNCRGVVTIDSRSGAVTRNVEYYALAHASRFVLPGARRIASTSDTAGVKTVAFRNEDGSKVLIALNQAGAPRTLVVRARGPWFTVALP
ncbi:MAG TPA: glycoside hydrolase family 30 beta sandwich domain-containing protein, partial [Gemmatimonadaceae bacterium]|nr:glycoside hydrolase family 30 beta sandwich domain-containing protein [Gemmatimonadaceae bacterium]